MTSGVNMSSRIAVVIFLLPSRITITLAKAGSQDPKGLSAGPLFKPETGSGPPLSQENAGT
jgi:hypothetical protein